MRVRVTDVLELLANGLNHDQIIQDLPDLQREVIQACLKSAGQRFDHPVVAP